MRAIGCLLMISGLCIVVAALLLLGSVAQRSVFMGAGLAVELLGLALLTHHHRGLEKRR